MKSSQEVTINYDSKNNKKDMFIIIWHALYLEGRLGLRSGVSYSRKALKSGSLQSALSVDLENPEAEKIRKEFEMYRMNKENEIANIQKSERRTAGENKRLRAELQALQVSHCSYAQSYNKTYMKLVLSPFTCESRLMFLQCQRLSALMNHNLCSAQKIMVIL